MMSKEKTITSMSTENRKIDPSASFREKAYVKSEIKAVAKKAKRVMKLIPSG